MSRVHIMEAIEDSLRRLQMDYIDIYYIHHVDVQTPLDEMLRALDDLVRQGKVRYTACSNYEAWRLMEAMWISDHHDLARFACYQPQYSLVVRDIEQEIMPVCQLKGLGIVPWSPLAGGFLTGKYTREEGAPEGSRGESSQYVQNYMTDANYTKVEKLTAWAQDRDHTMAELAHAWLLTQPQVCSVISGLTRLEHLQQNAKAADWQLTAEEVSEVNEILAD
jgi:aryl-alcohol dehydrogenase-like predicted oxidoreductase